VIVRQSHLYLRWLEEPSGTPQVLGSTPRGSEFQADVKKIPSLALCAKALVVSRPQVGLRTLTWPRQVVPRGYVSQCQGGARVRGFSRSGKPSLLLDNTGGAVFPHPAEFFYKLNITHQLPQNEFNTAELTQKQAFTESSHSLLAIINSPRATR